MRAEPSASKVNKYSGDFLPIAAWSKYPDGRAATTHRSFRLMKSLLQLIMIEAGSLSRAEGGEICTLHSALTASVGI